MLEVVSSVKLFVKICIGNTSLWVWMDSIDYYIGSYIGTMLVVRIRFTASFSTKLMPM
jgi:hypothetical protein